MKDGLLKYRQGKDTNKFKEHAYLQLENEEDNEEENEEENEEGVVERDENVQTEAQRAANATQLRNVNLGVFFQMLTASSIIALQFPAFQQQKHSPHHALKGYTRVAFSLLVLFRAVATTQTLLLAGQVKRNAIYVYPNLANFHITITVMNVATTILEMVVYLTETKKTTGLFCYEMIVAGINLAIICHCALFIFHQHHNGWSCKRRVEGEESDTFVPGSGPMAIGESNRGPIRTTVDESFYEFNVI